MIKSVVQKLSHFLHSVTTNATTVSNHSSTTAAATSITKSSTINNIIYKYIFALISDLIPPHIRGPLEISKRLSLITLLIFIFPILPIYGMFKFLSFLRHSSKVELPKSIKDSKNDEWKMIILVRSDLNMGKGKAAVQCCHSVLECYKQALSLYPSHVQEWEGMGQPKVTLKVMNEAELNELVWKARKAGLPAQAIRDAGRTQLRAGTKTVASIGPGPSKMIDLITGHLKLY